MDITYEDFEKVEMRVGEIIRVEEFPKARNPSYRLQIDFGPEIGTRWSSAAVRREYKPEEMLGRQVVAVVNFAPKNIAGFMSEVLVLGVPDKEGGVSLLQPSRPGVLGGRVY